MAAPGKRSGWGSLLSQAVAGVEARLDNILTENEEAAARENAKSSASTTAALTAATPAEPSRKPSPGKSLPLFLRVRATKTPSDQVSRFFPGPPSRTSSTNRGNDRLQERLARALAAKSAAQKLDPSSAKPGVSPQASPRPSSDLPSRSSIDSADRSSQIPADTISQRGSQDVPRKSEDSAPQSVETSTANISNGESGDHEASASASQDGANGQRSSSDHLDPQTAAAGEDAASTTGPSEAITESDVRPPAQGSGDEEKLKELQQSFESAQLQHQEELHSYVERIDTLEAKLQFLARETAESARKAALAAPSGSAEKKLAEKDQQLAQLMEEGKNLASTEHKQRAVIKKLRSKITEDEKELKGLKETQEKTTRELQALRNKASRADELEKTQQDLQRRLDQSQKELSTLRPEISSKDATISELKRRLEVATEQADEMTAKVNSQAREQDRRRLEELEETVATLKVEKDLVADRAKVQANELTQKAERATERCRALELEMKAESQVMESKLEEIRARAEEASSGATGDSQAKLLRQVETLQTQYSIATDNWQGIESTLLARIAGLEKERDEASRRESEMRKKAREAVRLTSIYDSAQAPFLCSHSNRIQALRAKRHEEELEEANTKLPSFQNDAKAHQTQLEAITKRAEQAEAALAETKAELEKQKNILKAEKEDRQERADQERRGWLEDIPAPFRVNSRPESPLMLTTPQRTFSSDLLGLEGFSTKSRKVSAPSSNNGGYTGERSYSRRPSAQPPSRPSIQPSTTGQSTSSPFSPSMDSLPAQSSSIHQIDRDDAFEGAETSSSPHQVLQDMVSVSTVAAGPSVQLVERMSAGIRRLESEKVAAREELARISNQRDEARAEILALMREVETGKSAAERVTALESEVAEVTARYETTLELLGEKSELVEELRADVQDVKAMYRDLVERTIK